VASIAPSGSSLSQKFENENSGRLFEIMKIPVDPVQCVTEQYNNKRKQFHLFRLSKRRIQPWVHIE